MPTGRPKRVEIALTPEACMQLEELAHACSLPHGMVRRAQIILVSAVFSNDGYIEQVPQTGLRGDRSTTRRKPDLFRNLVFPPQSSNEFYEFPVAIQRQCGE